MEHNRFLKIFSSVSPSTAGSDSNYAESSFWVKFRRRETFFFSRRVDHWRKVKSYALLFKSTIVWIISTLIVLSGLRFGFFLEELIIGCLRQPEFSSYTHLAPGRKFRNRTARVRDPGRPGHPFLFLWLVCCSREVLFALEILKLNRLNVLETVYLMHWLREWLPAEIRIVLIVFTECRSND